MAYMSNKQYMPFLVGNKVYGGGRSFPNIGPSDKLGYRERDLKHKAKREALERRMKAKKNKQYMSADFKRSV